MAEAAVDRRRVAHGQVHARAGAAQHLAPALHRVPVDVHPVQHARGGKDPGLRVAQQVSHRASHLQHPANPLVRQHREGDRLQRRQVRKQGVDLELEIELVGEW